MRRLSIAAITLVLPLVLAVPAEAAYPVYMKNSAISSVNLSITTSNPARSGNIFSVRPGYAGTGLGFYAPCGRVTQYYTASTSTRTATPCAWKYLPYTNEQYTVRIT